VSSVSGTTEEGCQKRDHSLMKNNVGRAACNGSTVGSELNMAALTWKVGDGAQNESVNTESKNSKNTRRIVIN
jgi:hypothetical protein